MSRRYINIARAIQVFSIAASVDVGKACTGLAWWLRGKRVRGSNMLLATAARSPKFYRFWISKIEPGGAEESQETLVLPRIQIIIFLLAPEYQEALSSCHTGASVKQSMPANVRGVSVKIVDSLADDIASFSGLCAQNYPDFDYVYVVPIQLGDSLAERAVSIIGNAIARADNDTILFWDEDKIEHGERLDPWLKATFDPLLFFARDGLTGASALSMAMLRDCIAKHGDFPASASGLFTLLAKMISANQKLVFSHIPAILTHRGENTIPLSAAERSKILNAYADPTRIGKTWVAQNVPDLVEYEFPFPSVAPSVTIIIPTRNRADLLKTCIESLQATDYRGEIEITVVDNQSDEEETLNFLRSISLQGINVLNFSGPFNFAKINNYAVEKSSSEFICMMNNDIEVLSPDWLTKLISAATQSSVGCVAPLLLYPGRTVQHAGVEIGVGGAAGHAHRHLGLEDKGHAWLHRITREVSAVTAACLVVRKADYCAVGGLDEQLFPVAFNDVDFCLKLGALGRKNIFVASTALIHHESLSRKSDYLPENLKRFQKELAALKRKWKTDNTADPFRSPLLSRDSEEHTLGF